jgi:hypothetical protein
MCIKVLIREAFLSARSTVFERKIDQARGTPGWDDPSAIVLENMRAETFFLFREWSYMKEPEVPSFESLNEVLDMGFMADELQIRVLTNQVSDLLR